MACGILYKDAIVITTVEKVGSGEDVSYRLNLPFQIFGMDAVCLGQSATYRLDQYEGQEVMAKVDYKVEDEKEVKKFSGYLGDPKKAAKYATHYPVTLADAKATYVNEVKVPYDGPDKAERAAFCEALSFEKKLGAIKDVAVEEKIV